jgi:membrane protease YdiL (CAAX protease family)
MRIRAVQDATGHSTNGHSTNGHSTNGHSTNGRSTVRTRAAGRLVARHPLATFFVLSYAIAWAWLPFGSFGAFSPLVAAAVVIAITEGGAGFRRLASRLLRWRIGWRWYAAAVALPLGTLLMAGTANRALGAPAPSLAQFTPWHSVLLLFAMNLVNPLGGPMGEEPGWRGYAQPGLQQARSPLAATGIMAVLVTGWHLPLLLPTFGLRPIELLSTVAVTVWYAWLFNRSGGSVLPALVAHAVDASLETSTLWSGADASRLITLWAGVASALAIVLVAVDRRSWTRRPPTGQLPTGQLPTGQLPTGQPPTDQPARPNGAATT